MVEPVDTTEVIGNYAPTWTRIIGGQLQHLGFQPQDIRCESFANQSDYLAQLSNQHPDIMIGNDDGAILNGIRVLREFLGPDGNVSLEEINQHLEQRFSQIRAASLDDEALFHDDSFWDNFRNINDLLGVLMTYSPDLVSHAEIVLDQKSGDIQTSDGQPNYTTPLAGEVLETGHILLHKAPGYQTPIPIPTDSIRLRVEKNRRFIQVSNVGVAQPGLKPKISTLDIPFDKISSIKLCPRSEEGRLELSLEGEHPYIRVKKGKELLPLPINDFMIHHGLDHAGFIYPTTDNNGNGSVTPEWSVYGGGKWLTRDENGKLLGIVVASSQGHEDDPASWKGWRIAGVLSDGGSWQKFRYS